MSSVEGLSSEAIPTTVGKYRLLAELGQGGMARVFLAVSHGPSGFSKLVVLKMVRSHLTEDADMLQMFLDEARLAGRLNHPNVVQTYEVSEYDGRHVLVMEYLEGQSLSTVLRKNKPDEPGFTTAQCIRVLIEALNGLQYAHELRDLDGTILNLVHRDVSPQNIFVTYDGSVKVLDFGIAKAVTSASETRAGVIKGKIAYMAPEQFLGEAIDRRVDVFAVGALIWQILTGVRLWKGVPDGRVIHRVIAGDIPKPSEVAENVPPELERVCMKALSRNREDRHASAVELQKDLEDVLEVMGQRVSLRDLGTRLDEMFKDVRTHIRTSIETQLSKANSGEDVLMASPMLLRSGGTRTSTLTSGTGPGSWSNPNSGPLSPEESGRMGLPVDTGSGSVRSQVSGMANSIPAVDVEFPQKKKYLLPAIVGGIALLIGGAVLVPSIRSALSGGGTPPPVASTAPSAPTDTSAAAQNTADSAPATTAATGEEIELVVQATPEKARLFWDDAELPTNPYSKKLPKDGKEHKIRAEATGYETSIKLVRADQGGTLKIELQRERHYGGPAIPGAKTAKSEPAEPTPAVVEPTPATPKTAKPPASAAPRDRIKTIDKSNPWN